MARYYRRRTYTRVVRPKKKWGSNMIDVDVQIPNTTAGIASGYHVVTLAMNKLENSSPTPVVIKTGNFKLQGDVYVTNNAQTASTPVIKCFIVFLPQGMNIGTYDAAVNLVQSHPEWILAWKVLDTGYVSGGTPVDFSRFSMSSRLKRNLNSGDAVVCVITANSLTANSVVDVHGMCQFWTCAN